MLHVRLGCSQWILVHMLRSVLDRIMHDCTTWSEFYKALFSLWTFDLLHFFTLPKIECHPHQVNSLAILSKQNWTLTQFVLPSRPYNPKHHAYIEIILRSVLMCTHSLYLLLRWCINFQRIPAIVYTDFAQLHAYSVRNSPWGIPPVGGRYDAYYVIMPEGRENLRETPRVLPPYINKALTRTYFKEWKVKAMPGYELQSAEGEFLPELLCSECRLLMREPVQTVDGVRMCKSCLSTDTSNPTWWLSSYFVKAWTVIVRVRSQLFIRAQVFESPRRGKHKGEMACHLFQTI